MPPDENREEKQIEEDRYPRNFSGQIISITSRVNGPLCEDFFELIHVNIRRRWSWAVSRGLRVLEKTEHLVKFGGPVVAAAMSLASQERHNVMLFSNMGIPEAR